MENNEAKKIQKLLQHVDDLHEKGVLSDSAYDAKKQELISRLYHVSQSVFVKEKVPIKEKSDFKEKKTDIYEEKYKSMSLIRCPNCGKQVSNKVAFCIHCGYPIDTSKTKHVIVTPAPQISRQEPKRVRNDEANEPKTRSAFMAFLIGGLRKCPTCGKPIANNAKRCPHCGRRDPFIFSHMLSWLLFLIIFLSLFGFFKK